MFIDPNKAFDALNSGVSVEDICKLLNTIAKTDERLSSADLDSTNDVTGTSDMSSQDDANHQI